MERLILSLLADAWPEAMTSTQIADALWHDRCEPYPLTSVKTRLVKMTHTGVVERGPGNRGYRQSKRVSAVDAARLAGMVRAYGLDAVLDAARSEHERLAEVSR